MKRHSTSLLILIALILLACAKPETSEQVLRRLMEGKMKDGKFEGATTPGKLSRISNDQEGPGYWLDGRYRMRNELLIVTIQDNVDANQEYYTGVFKADEKGWISLFDAELMPGRLDTLLDFNGDGTDEFILDEYKGNSAGFDSFQFLYAKRDRPNLEKIDTLSRRFQVSGNALQTQMNFNTDGDGTSLTIRSVETNFQGGGTPVEKEQVYLYRWQPPNFIKEKVLVEYIDAPADPLVEALIGFPRKWYPLAETDGKLMRQQLCGTEDFIEIMDGEEYRWREQGLQDVLEATIEDFTNRGPGYFLQLKMSDGGKREINIEPNLEIDFVYTINGRAYTAKPDKFEIKNNTDECGN